NTSTMEEDNMANIEMIFIEEMFSKHGENQLWGSDEMLDGESSIWINMEGNLHDETDFRRDEGNGISKQGPKHQEPHMESLLP
ncbi:hypothetical protein KI387_016212, partial [Taxus chinensis]